MALLCYNRSCGQKFEPETNAPDACLHHPGFPIFHDALKGWSCCKKRTTDFSEFLSIKGCAKGYHSNEKPPESEEALNESKVKMATEIIVQGPKSAEMMERERPSSDEPKQLLPVKVSKTLEQALGKLDLTAKEESPVHGSAEAGSAPEVTVGTSCKNSGCKATYQGEESNMETCVFHPGVPVFHEGMKYWSCCGIKTTDFTAFLEQKGCSRGRHIWAKKQQQDKKLVTCRQDWHQTGGQVVVTVYAKSPRPELSSVKANRTRVDIRIVFEGDKVFQAEMELWGVINVQKSFVTMLPSKVEVALQKDGLLTWARLEHPQSKAEDPRQHEAGTSEPGQEPRYVAQDESDDSLSWSEEEEEEWEEGRGEESPASTNGPFASGN